MYKQSKKALSNVFLRKDFQNPHMTEQKHETFQSYVNMLCSGEGDNEKQMHKFLQKNEEYTQNFENLYFLLGCAIKMRKVEDPNIWAFFNFMIKKHRSTLVVSKTDIDAASMFIQNFAKYKKLDSENYPLFMKIIEENIKHLNHLDLAELGWVVSTGKGGDAKYGVPDAQINKLLAKIYHVLDEQLQKSALQLKENQLRLILFSLAKSNESRYMKRATLEMLRDLFIRNMKFFKEVEVSSILWCLSKLQVLNYDSLQQISSHINTFRLTDLSDKELLNITYSLAKNDYYTQGLFLRIEDEIYRRIKRLDLLGITNAMWSFSKSKQPIHRGLLLVLKQSFLEQIEKNPVSYLCVGLNALAQAEALDIATMTQVDPIIYTNISKFSNLSLVDLLSSFSKSKIVFSDTFGKVESQVLSRLNKCTERELMIFFWFFAKSYLITKEGTIKAFLSKVEEFLANSRALNLQTAEGYASLFCSLAILDPKYDIKKYIDKLMSVPFLDTVIKNPKKFNTYQIYKSVYYLKLKYWHENEHPQLDDFLEKSRAYFRELDKSGAYEPKTNSKFQRDVFKIVEDILATDNSNRVAKYEHKLDDVLSCDIFVEPNTIIEVNGPFHYFSEKKINVGFDTLMHELCKLNGYKIVGVGHFKWEELNEEQKVQYVRDLLT